MSETAIRPKLVASSAGDRLRKAAEPKPEKAEKGCERSEHV